jgi:hypothetical protein
MSLELIVGMSSIRRRALSVRFVGARLRARSTKGAVARALRAFVTW